MGIALDFAHYLDTVALKVDTEHDRVTASRPPNNASDFPAWQLRMDELRNQYASLSGTAMALRNVDAQQAMQQIGPQLEAIKDATQKAAATIKTITDINNVLTLVTAVVGVAVAIAAVITDPIAGAPGLVTAGQALAIALKPYEKNINNTKKTKNHLEFKKCSGQ